MTQVNSFLFNLRHLLVIPSTTPFLKARRNSSVLFLWKLLPIRGGHIFKFFFCHGLSHAF